MGATTKQVGGGAATGTANQWNQFLGQQLGQQGMGGAAGGGYTGGAGGGDGTDTFGGGMQSQNAQGSPVAPGGFQGALNNLMSGQGNDVSGAGAAASNFLKNPTQYGNQYTNQNYTAATTPGGNGMADLSKIGATPQSNFNTQKTLGNVNSDQTAAFNNLITSGNTMLNNGMGGYNPAAAGTGVSLGQAANVDLNNPLVQAQQAGIDRQKNLDIANLRARFGAEGAGAMGTGAQFGESQLAAEYAPKSAAILQQSIQQQQQQDLAERQARAGVDIQSSGLGVQQAIANMQGGLQGAQNQNSMYSQMLGNLNQARGQDLSTGLGMRGQDLQQLGLGSEQSIANMNAGLQGRGQDLNAQINNQQLGNNWGMGNAQMQNNFNLSNAGNMAQYGLGAQQLNSSNFNNMVNAGMNQNALGQQGQQAGIGNMFGAYGQSNSLGTAQAQTIQQANPWMQAAQMGLGLGGQLLGGPLGGQIGSIFGSGGGGGGGGQSAYMPNGMNYQSQLPSFGFGGGAQMPPFSLPQNYSWNQRP